MNKHLLNRSSSNSNLECCDLGSRVRSVRGDRSQLEYSKQLNIGISTLRRYEGNQRQPDATALNAICKVDGVLSDWILRGKGPMHKGDEPEVLYAKPVDIDLLQRAIEVVDDVLNESNRELASDKKAQLIGVVYDMYSESEEKPEKGKILQLVKLAA